MGCLPKPKQDYTMEQLKAMESLEEIMRVQASTMDPQFAKIGKQLVEEDFALLSKAATRMQATAEAVVAKHSDKRPAGFKTLAEQFGKQAADLVAAADAKDNKASCSARCARPAAGATKSSGRTHDFAAAPTISGG
jgi:hypothetical protein